MQNIHKKETFHRQYKDYRNMLSTFFKKRKSNYNNQYFRANMNNIKNTWKGIKSILTIKNLSSDIPQSILQWFDHHQQSGDFKYL